MEKQTVAHIKKQLQLVTNEQDERLIQARQDERSGVKAAVAACEKRLLKQAAEQERLILMTAFEREKRAQGFRHIAGIDEAGRGPLAGPVVAAACILPPGFLPLGLNDSKKLSEAVRDELYAQIQQNAFVGVGIVEAAEIDQINIYEAARQAMKRAVESLPIEPDCLLVDAMQVPLPVEQESIIKGDAKSASIAAASIIAKVTRDRLMKDYAVQYPGYGFEQNMGYGTKAHLDGLNTYGVTPLHRKTFAPVKNML